MLVSFCLLTLYLQQPTGDTLTQRVQSVVFVQHKTTTVATPLSLPGIPQPIQGFFCNFEYQIQRKKVPLDFGLKLK